MNGIKFGVYPLLLKYDNGKNTEYGNGTACLINYSDKVFFTAAHNFKTKPKFNNLKDKCKITAYIITSSISEKVDISSVKFNYKNDLAFFQTFENNYFGDFKTTLFQGKSGKKIGSNLVANGYTRQKQFIADVDLECIVSINDFDFHSITGKFLSTNVNKGTASYKFGSYGNMENQSKKGMSGGIILLVISEEIFGMISGNNSIVNVTCFTKSNIISGYSKKYLNTT